jgi:hypothetical protein
MIADLAALVDAQPRFRFNGVEQRVDTPPQLV